VEEFPYFLLSPARARSGVHAQIPAAMSVAVMMPPRTRSTDFTTRHSSYLTCTPVADPADLRV
jgi:hypothetical protein